MLGAELAFSKAFIDAFVMQDVFDEEDSLQRVLRVLDQVHSDEQALLVGRAYGRALLVLESDLPRWRAATDVAVRLDLHEVLPALLNGLSTHPDPHQLANAVTLAAGPAVSADMHSRVVAVVAATDLTQSLQRLLTLRLEPNAKPAGDLEAVVHAQAWPGTAGPALLPRLAPTVYLAESAAPPIVAWRVAAALGGAGARLRRLPPVWSREVPNAWFQPAYPVVSWSGTSVALLRDHFPGVMPKVVNAPSDMSSPLDSSRLLARCATALPRGVALRRTPDWSSTELPAFAPESLGLGGFDAPEMSYLGAASPSVVRKFASQDVLRPYEADVQRWSFDKLVTLRIVQAFKGRGVSLRADPVRILTKLEELATASETRRVGIDSKGVIFVEGERSWEVMHTGQRAMPDAVLVDDAFRSFRIGGGSVPDLLRPGQHTTVHPAVLGGTPVVDGRRLSARALAQLLNARGEKVLRSAYPELEPMEIADAARVGREIIRNTGI